MPCQKDVSRRRAPQSTTTGLAWAVSLLALVTLCGCGDGSGSVDADRASTQAVDAKKKPQAVVATAANAAGAWTAPFEMGFIAVHLILQPDGRVMYFGARPDAQSAAFEYGVWDPALGSGPDSVMVLPNSSGTDPFCGSQTLLPLDGRTFIAGGDTAGPDNTPSNNSNLFDFRTNGLGRTANMNRARWYSTTTTLMNGEVYIQGGLGGTDRPEVRQQDGSFRLLSTTDTSGVDYYYPRNWVAPDGRLFGIDSGGSGKTYYVDASGTGSLAYAGQIPAAHATMAGTGAAMFRPGRILGLNRFSTAAAVIDINRGTPVVNSTESASAIRDQGVATVLADGRVLSTGGSATFNTLADAAYTADVWNPVTGEWTIGARHKNARLYHGTALLLPDARVLLAGGGSWGPLANTNGEIYSPSYLFDAHGALAARPVITNAPTVVEPGQVFSFDTASTAISRVTLVRTGSVSHGWNNDQRMSDLPFTAAASGSGARLTARLPSRATDTPPGYYMLFAFDAQGVPSVAKILRVNVPGARPDASAPAMADIPDQSWSSAANLQPVARSPVSAPLSYTASGLPAGLSIARTTGAITGIPTQSGTHFVTVSADDGQWTASRSFLWTVSVSAPLPQPVSPGQTSVGGTVNVTLAGGASSYSWNFGDGSPATAVSASASASHVYTAPGVYTVTVTGYNAQGLPRTASFLQTVRLPATSGKPAQSSQMALTGTGAAQRLWVVNPDSNTVSVLDTTTRTRLREIEVGEHPVALAEAADGRVWVSNERSASLSVIDPANLSVLRTLSLPYGSQPWGLAASGRVMYAVLQGSGKLLRFDITSLAQTGEAHVYANPRHVSVRGDGLAIFVSRFITPALPGEGTANVQTAGRGGELLKVDAASFTAVNTLVLGHNERPDAENQGRGIPNYLGALAISPDGTQGFVPSKQDNLKRGTLRDGQNLNFQNTVRAITSRVVMANETEDLNARIDHDNASVASAAVFDPSGVYLFVALETSREVAVVNAHNRQQLMRIDTGLAPQSLAVSSDGKTLYVGNFMDRSVGVYDLGPLLSQGQASLPLVATISTTAADMLSPTVLRGKQLFYDARDTRLARDRYMSCASCHNDGGHDGRVWDLTGFGEGLRNTISLRGRAGMGHGQLHWSANFDEVQDFEGQIRTLAGGTGLMSDAAFNTGTRSQPLGDRKSGASADLDALAAYVGSLTTFDATPFRGAGAPLSAAALAGKQVFLNSNCASCHGGAPFTGSADASRLKSIGTVKPSSGKRLGATLTGIDAPTLRDVWQTAPYLHDGSAPTLAAAVSAHNSASMGGVTLDATQMSNLVAYLQQIGADEAAAPGNLALGKTATQSSDYLNAKAGLAVDGNTNGTFWDGSVTHTASAAAQGWWQVDLGQQSAIDAIELWNRTDCCTNRLSNFYVLVSSSNMSGRTLAQLLADPTVSKQRVGALSAPSLRLTMPTRGRFVKVQLEGSEFLSLAEVKVFGTPGSNLALGKSARQSSSLGIPNNARLAVDGITDGNYPAWSVTHTNNAAAQNWWQVDLGQQRVVDAVEVWNRTDCCSYRLSNFYVFVSASDMSGRTLAGLVADPAVSKQRVEWLGTPNITLAPSARGRYVKVQLEGSDYLSLAEVKVFGTSQ